MKIKDNFVNESVYFAIIVMKLIKFSTSNVYSKIFYFQFYKYKILLSIFKLAEIPAHWQQTY